MGLRVGLLPHKRAWINLSTKPLPATIIQITISYKQGNPSKQRLFSLVQHKAEFICKWPRIDLFIIYEIKKVVLPCEDDGQGRNDPSVACVALPAQPHFHHGAHMLILHGNDAT